MVSKNLREEAEVGLNKHGGGTVYASYKGDAYFGSKGNLWTIPLEVSTDVRLLYIFDFFGGLGVDLNFGQVTLEPKIDGEISFYDPKKMTTHISGKPQLNLGGSDSRGFVTYRAFYGLQVNLSLLKLVAQINQGISDNTVGANLGIRIAW